MKQENIDFLIIPIKSLLKVSQHLTNDNDNNSKIITNLIGKPIKLIDWETVKSFDFDVKPLVLKTGLWYFYALGYKFIYEYNVFHDNVFSYDLLNVVNGNIQLIIEKTNIKGVNQNGK